MINAETKTTATKRSFGKGLLLLAIVFLTNPVVNIFDYLPDFIAYIIIVKALGYYADRVPYFDEARRDFKSLLIISLAKIPSYFIMIYARGQNTMDYDVSAMFSFVFAVLEVAFLTFALKNLFRALWYIGERTDASSVISQFAISKSGKRRFAPEALERISYIFIFYKAGATFLPEMLLLTRSNVNFGINLPMLYPYCIIFSFVSVLIFGIILSKRFRCYVKAIYAEGKMRFAAENLLSTEARSRLYVRLNTRDMSYALSLLVIAAFTLIDVRFDNFSGINLMPGFVFGFITLLSVLRMRKHVSAARSSIIATAIYTLAAIVSSALEASFLEKHGYSALLEKNAEAIAMRGYIILASSLELVAFIVLFVTLARLIIRFAERHTGLDVHDERYGRLDAEYHKTIKKKVWIFAAFGIAQGCATLIDSLFNLYPSLEKVTNEIGSSHVVLSLVPAFTLVVLISTVLYIIYAIHLVDLLKGEVEQKYS